MSGDSERRFREFVVALAVLILAAAPARAEWVAAAYLGAARTASAPLAIVQPAAGTDVTFTAVPYDGESFRSPLYYGYRLTYFPRQESWWGFEAEFIHLKAYADTAQRTHVSGRHHGAPIEADIPIEAILNRFSISHGLNFLVFNAVARRSIGARAGASGYVVLVARVGAGPTIPHAESTIDGVDREGYAWGAAALHLAGGVEVRVWRGLGAIAEYKYTRTRQTVDVARGEARGVFSSHHGIVGVAVRL